MLHPRPACGVTTIEWFLSSLAPLPEVKHIYFGPRWSHEKTLKKMYIKHTFRCGCILPCSQLWESICHPITSLISPNFRSGMILTFFAHCIDEVNNRQRRAQESEIIICPATEYCLWTHCTLQLWIGWSPIAVPIVILIRDIKLYHAYSVGNPTHSMIEHSIRRWIASSLFNSTWARSNAGNALRSKRRSYNFTLTCLFIKVIPFLEHIPSRHQMINWTDLPEKSYPNMTVGFMLPTVPSGLV